MSKDIFMADYSECRDTNREIKSNLNYIEDILSRLKSMDNLIQKVDTPSSVWDKSNYESDFAIINRYLNEETNRYNNFHTAFEAFYTPLEKIDAGLKAVLTNSLNFIEETKEYGVYVSIIKSSGQEELVDSIYNELIKQGVSKEDALKISALANEETQELLKELAGLDENELKKKIDEIKQKAKQSPSEIVLLDLLSADQPNTYSDMIKDLSQEFATGGFVGVLEKGYLGKNLDKYQLDIRSLTGQINKLNRQITNSQLSASKVNMKTETMERLKAIRESKLSKVDKVDYTKNNLSKISKWLGIAATAYNIGKISYDEWKNYSENGAELDDVVVDAGISWGGIMASASAGAYLGSEAGEYIGTIITPGVGTVVGLGVGFVAGGLVGVAYDSLVKPILTDVYNNIVEPAGDWIADKANDIGDWWDSLCW
ncbi:hypothetical protein BD780_002148 [Clostridium tetanomorphum]|uniref:LXG domain-containing protein n=1 Tax=Clostridium tetanomorphum TaxID=1553 RepID=A0A923J099_CLOTT|nr:hypothetical protein [Clostridium tetanomorphum]KAJ49497.1 hypothetical protein CTM_22876 [Clostridium tetanomorphum DSM 665]KAJ51426.1 hypothetical protein CTM_12580 [Clostridium tetanomorphum DSM 665]MBC2396520.1 hypothetical protein [Clostridium tetanomorphum]MBP1863845.1 hypothetical protein [Clostridium tetanomorphum]NRS84923.1 hypothetical protein [Clostridium tetanomorphum]